MTTFIIFVLAVSRAFVDLSLVIEGFGKGLPCDNRNVENFTVSLTRGDKVSCDLCHRNYMLAAVELG